jgi:hypothetical protein
MEKREKKKKKLLIFFHERKNIFYIGLGLLIILLFVLGFIYSEDLGLDFWESTEISNIDNGGSENAADLPSGGGGGRGGGDGEPGDVPVDNPENLGLNNSGSGGSGGGGGGGGGSGGGGGNPNSNTNVNGNVCGDEIVNTSEQCDGTNLTGLNCTTITGGYISGNLSCTDECLFNVTECVVAVSQCGDLFVNVSVGEVCDPPGSNSSCVTADNYLGNQTCLDDCLNYDVCNPTEWCGDGIENGDEECDYAISGNEENCTTGCVLKELNCLDGLDNDNDLEADCADSDCDEVFCNVEETLMCIEGSCLPACEGHSDFECREAGCPGPGFLDGRKQCQEAVGDDGWCCPGPPTCESLGGVCAPNSCGSESIPEGDASCQNGEGEVWEYYCCNEVSCSDLGGTCANGFCPGSDYNPEGRTDCYNQGFEFCCNPVTDACESAGGTCMPDCSGADPMSDYDYSCASGEGESWEEYCCEVVSCEDLGGSCSSVGCNQGHPQIPEGNGDCYSQQGFDSFCCQTEQQDCFEAGGECTFNCPAGHYAPGDADCPGGGTLQCCVNPGGCDVIGGTCFSGGCDTVAGWLHKPEGEAQCVGENSLDWFCCVNDSPGLSPELREEKSLIRRILDYFFRPKFVFRE